MPLKFCANLSFMFQETASLLDRYTLAEKCGFKAVECAFPYCHSVSSIVEAKTGAGVEQILINVPPACSYPHMFGVYDIPMVAGDSTLGELGHAALPGKESVFQRNIDLAVQYAKALSCKRVHIMSGKVPNPTVENASAYEENLKYAVGCMEKEDITALIEPINNFTVPNYYMNTLAIVKKINSPHLKIMMDLFHLQIINGDLTRNIKKYLPYVGHIQIAQVPNRNEPNTPGEMNYPYIFSLLEELKYDGWIGLEYKPLTTTANGLNWIQDYKIEL
ncbi:hypothetical protein J437_LFUL005515 [Ladona fulva]|uniref:Putative hydroxypyruvate isomerase n=1 Tax=Ladona fulva TaxID=123851 RepID=A0A8K0P0I9_LADFU|nr:hypothetical protein J437_LFUL005515 [Ladona fulva]